MKVIITREELEKAVKKINKCPCCGSMEFEHTCGGSPEVFENRSNEIEIEVKSILTKK